MAIIKCLECGKEISDKSSTCIYCGCPIEYSVKNKANKNAEILTVLSKNKNTSIMNKAGVLCKVAILLASYAEFRSFGGYLNEPVLLIGSLLLLFEFLFLLFVFPKDVAAVKITSIILFVTEIIYGIGMISFSASAEGRIIFPIMCLSNAIIWLSVFLKISNKPILILEKFKLLYIIVPLLKPILFLTINIQNLSGFLFWLPSAIACAFVGYFIGFNKNEYNYSHEELIKIRKSYISKFLLIAFPPIGLILTWKNKCLKKIARVICSILSIIWFIFIIIILLPCDHNWVNGSCTVAPECDICGKVAENASGHLESDWSEWNIDYDEAVNVRKKVCPLCDEVLDTETTVINSFIVENNLTIHPAGFVDRFEEQSKRLDGIEYEAEKEYNKNASFYDEKNTVYYRIKDINNNYSDIGIISFNTVDGETVPISNIYSENSIGAINILIEDSYDVSAVVYSAILAIDPNIGYNEAADVGQEVVDNIAIAVGETNGDNFKGVDYNGINYLLFKDRNYHYLIIKPA